MSGTLITKIKSLTGLKEVYVIGVELISSYIERDEGLIQRYNLRKFREPLRINPEDLKLLILKFDENKNDINENLKKKKPKVFDVEDKKSVNNSMFARIYISVGRETRKSWAKMRGPICIFVSATLLFSDASSGVQWI